MILAYYWPLFDSDLHRLLGEIKHLRKLKILVADDSKPSKMTTMFMLEHLGCVTKGADDGLEALSLSESEEFDLIFLDEKMPGLLGSDVAKKLCDGDGVNTKTPKVSLTGITDRGSITELYSKGITHHIEKPITKLILDNFLQQWRKD
jgi:CheY-like chemotaxis protein